MQRLRQISHHCQKTWPNTTVGLSCPGSHLHEVWFEGKIQFDLQDCVQGCHWDFGRAWQAEGYCASTVLTWQVIDCWMGCDPWESTWPTWIPTCRWVQADGNHCPHSWSSVLALRCLALPRSWFAAVSRAEARGPWHPPTPAWRWDFDDGWPFCRSSICRVGDRALLQADHARGFEQWAHVSRDFPFCLVLVRQAPSCVACWCPTGGNGPDLNLQETLLSWRHDHQPCHQGPLAVWLLRQQLHQDSGLRGDDDWRFWPWILCHGRWWPTRPCNLGLWVQPHHAWRQVGFRFWEEAEGAFLDTICPPEEPDLQGHRRSDGVYRRERVSHWTWICQWGDPLCRDQGQHTDAHLKAIHEEPWDSDWHWRWNSFFFKDRRQRLGTSENKQGAFGRISAGLWFGEHVRLQRSGWGIQWTWHPWTSWWSRWRTGASRPVSASYSTVSHWKWRFGSWHAPWDWRCQRHFLWPVHPWRRSAHWLGQVLWAVQRRIPLRECWFISPGDWEGQFYCPQAQPSKVQEDHCHDEALTGYDISVNKLISGDKLKVSRKPPFGRTWLKQVFAGTMGLTILAVLYGMQFGIPRDICISDWDAATASGKRQLHLDLQQEDPYCTVLTQPCGPWGNWSRFNIAKGGSAGITVQRLREDGRPVLSAVNKTVRDRVKANRHIFLEQPLGSQVLEEPEMSDVKRMVEDGTLLYLVVDGCMVGYKDAVTGIPHRKSSFYITSMLVAESVFSNCRCDGLHQHEHLQGNNKYGSRTAQAAAWPYELNMKVLECIIQQAKLEEQLAGNVHEAFPAQVRPAPDQPSQRNPKRRREGKMSIIRSPAPPVYLRPQTLTPIAEEGPADQEVPEDDAAFRAQQAANLGPVLTQSETERRHAWIQVDAEIRKLLKQLHVNFGHPTSVTLQRILRRQGAKPEVITAAGLMACDACGESIRQKRPKPVRSPSNYVFNNHILADTFYAKDSKGTSLAFLNIICDATSFQVVSCLGELTGPPSSGVVLRHFLTSWSSWAGLPRSLQVDRGKEYMAQFSDFLKEYGAEQEVIPLESPWQNGRCERAGGLWKDVWNKVCIDVQVTTMADALTATSIVTQTRNAFPRPNGYSPNQWVLGHPEARLPGSLLNSDESQQLEVLEAAENPESAMAKNLSIREAARVAQIRLDTDSRVRRALLRQSTPTRGPFPVGSYVYFYRRQPQRHSTGRTYNWYGPARVIGVELRNPRRTEDGDPGTDGSAPHSYWLRYGPSVVLASGEQLRFASEDELLAAHYVPHYAVERGSERGARNYVDVRHQLLLPQSLPQQQLTGGGVVKHDFWQTHPDGRIIRVHNVPRRSLYTPEADGCPVPVEELQDQRVTEVI